MTTAIVEILMKLLVKILPFFQSNIDRDSPEYCDSCKKMKMSLIHSGKTGQIRKTAFGPYSPCRGLYYCKCGNFKIVMVAKPQVVTSKKKLKLIKELKAKGVIVEYPNGVVKYHLEKFHQNP